MSEIPDEPIERKSPKHMASVREDGTHADLILPEHLADLRGSGLDGETIEANAVRSEADPKVLVRMMRWGRWSLGAALVFPYFRMGESAPVFHRCKPDRPRLGSNGKKIVKYEQPRGVAAMPYFPARTRKENRFADGGRVVVITEGEKKAMLLDALGYAVIGLPGVDNFHDPKTLKDDARLEWHTALAHVSPHFNGRNVVIAFDSDARTNRNVRRAIEKIAGLIRFTSEGMPLEVEWPNDVGIAGKCGVDDFFVHHGEEALRALIGDAREVDADRCINPDNARDLFCRVPGLAGLNLPEDIRVPEPYTVTDAGAILIMPSSEKGEAKTVSRTPIVPFAIFENEDHGELVDLAYFGPHKQRRELAVSRGDARDTRRALKSFADGMPITTPNAATIVQWISDCLTVNTDIIPRGVLAERCGWHNVQGSRFFAIGEDAIGDEVDIYRSQLPRSLRDAFEPRGSAVMHREVLRDVIEADGNAAVAIYCALAAPLVRRIGLETFSLVLHGQSSRGKSSMSKIAASIYGNPRNQEWWGSADVTTNYIEVRANGLCDLPLFVDEIGSNKLAHQKGHEIELAKVIYNLSSGHGRGRLSRDSTMRKNAQYFGVVIWTGEKPLVEDYHPDGLHVRAMHVPVIGFGNWGPVQIENAVANSAENCGQFGREWLRAIAATSDEDLKREHVNMVCAMRPHLGAGEVDPMVARRAHSWALLAMVEGIAAKMLRANVGWVTKVRKVADDAMMEARGGTQKKRMTPADRFRDAIVASIESHGERWPVAVCEDGSWVTRTAGAQGALGYRKNDLVFMYMKSPDEIARNAGTDKVSAMQAMRQEGFIRRPKGVPDDARMSDWTHRDRINGHRSRVFVIEGIFESAQEARERDAREEDARRAEIEASIREMSDEEIRILRG